MRMGQGVRTGLGHRGITCVLQTQFSSLFSDLAALTAKSENKKGFSTPEKARITWLPG